MAKPKKLDISAKDKEVLEQIVKSRTVPVKMMERARTILLKAEGKSIDTIAKYLHKNRNSIMLWLKKFKKGGVDGVLYDEPGRGRKPEFSNYEKLWIIDLACRKPSEFGYSAQLWTYSKLTEHVNTNAEAFNHPRLSTISEASIIKILDAAEIKPFKIKYYCEKRDPDFKEKMHNILVAYKQVAMRFDENGNLLPKDNDEAEVNVISYDEKPGIQAIANSSPDLPPTLENGEIKRDYEYKRLGTLSLLAGIDLLTGKAIPYVSETHKSSDFICFLKILASKYPEKAKLRLILDNHSIHKSAETKAFLATMPGKFEFIFTPKHGSWLNLIEGFFGKMTHQMLRGIRVKTKDELYKRLYKYFDEINKMPVVPHWKYKMDEIDPNEDVKISLSI